MNQNKMKFYGLLGFLSGLFFMIGDFLIYIYPGLNYKAIEPVWAQMPEWRFIWSVVLGFVGMALMFFGFYSLYGMTVKLCGEKMKKLMCLGMIGVASTGYLHFVLGSLLPITFKSALAEGLSMEKASALAIHWKEILFPLNVILMTFLYIQFIVLIIMILSKKTGLSKWMIFVGPIGAVTIGLLWKILFKGQGIQGAWGACESLGEGLMYLVAYFYWRNVSVKEECFE